MKRVFLVEGSDYKSLKKLLEENPYGADSFSRVGYTLRESNRLGLKGGNYVLVFQCDDGAREKKLLEALKPIESLKVLDGSDRETVLMKLDSDEGSAAAGFGSIFS
ncbi:hypothetical protein KJ765_03540 [Candidatus Micrarchaeota archaeon]|nr:hypothetical protein [Candidatus Micrarchaeota archaeon]